MGKWNVVSRKSYKERGQLKSRKQKGFRELEKKRDYKVRSRKNHQIKKLKALNNRLIKNKNPDEYNSMMKHAEIDSKTGITKIYKFKKADDLENYRNPTPKHQRSFIHKNTTVNTNLLNTRLTQVTNQIDRLVSSVGALVNDPSKRKHKIFVRSREEFDSFDPRDAFNSDFGNPLHRYSTKQLLEEDLTRYPKRKEKQRAKLLEQLKTLKEEESTLRQALHEMALAREMALNPSSIDHFEENESFESELFDRSHPMKNVNNVVFVQERKR